jgi:hypothetical protein
VKARGWHLARANCRRCRANNAVGDRLTSPFGLHGSPSVSQEALPDSILQDHEIFINTHIVFSRETLGNNAGTMAVSMAHCRPCLVSVT